MSINNNINETTGECRSSSSEVLPKVILPLMISGLFFISAIAAIGRPQFATGPQKCCEGTNNEKITFWGYFIVTGYKYRINA